MHVGHNIKTKYYLHDNGLAIELEEVGEEKDLGVLNTKLPSQHHPFCTQPGFMNTFLFPTR